jgi:hypothetical protein
MGATYNGTAADQEKQTHNHNLNLKVNKTSLADKV